MDIEAGYDGTTNLRSIRDPRFLIRRSSLPPKLRRMFRITRATIAHPADHGRRRAVRKNTLVRHLSPAGTSLPISTAAPDLARQHQHMVEAPDDRFLQRRCSQGLRATQRSRFRTISLSAFRLPMTTTICVIMTTSLGLNPMLATRGFTPTITAWARRRRLVRSSPTP